VEIVKTIMKLKSGWHQIKSKVSFIALLVVIILLPIAVYLARNPGSAAGWFNDNWQYRQRIPITAHYQSAESNVYISCYPQYGRHHQSIKPIVAISALPRKMVRFCHTILPLAAARPRPWSTFSWKVFLPGPKTSMSTMVIPSVVNGYSITGFSTAATGVTVGSIGSEEKGASAGHRLLEI
jgi:hypothetical protein